ncbi:MAG: hypothetical protein QM817_25130 [Archangium sp.]
MAAPNSIDVCLLEWAADPIRPAMVIDERRFGPPRFAEERIVFAGVLTTVGDLIRFGAAVEEIRRTMDVQKQRRPLKAADVLSARHSKALQAGMVELLGKAQVAFWATSEPYLRAELAARQGTPVAIDQNSGAHLTGKELPVFQMIPGLAAEKQSVRARGFLEVFIDRSLQNGLHGSNPDILTVFDVGPSGAPATRDGKPIRLGEGVPQRWFPVCEETKMLGDWLLPADLSAHLWGANENTVDRIGAERLIRGIEFIGDAEGHRLIVELKNASQQSALRKLAKHSAKQQRRNERKA